MLPGSRGCSAARAVISLCVGQAIMLSIGKGSGLHRGLGTRVLRSIGHGCVHPCICPPRLISSCGGPTRRRWMGCICGLWQGNKSHSTCVGPGGPRLHLHSDVRSVFLEPLQPAIVFVVSPPKADVAPARFLCNGIVLSPFLIPFMNAYTA